MSCQKLDEILRLASNKNISDTGGAQAQKGISFQQVWALTRMFDLESTGANDFLFLFEIYQDVAELDSSTLPTNITIYQAKKKDRGLWTWNELTKLGKPSSNKKDLSVIESSPIGKLYANVIAFNSIEDFSSSGVFVTNAHCNFPLKSRQNASQVTSVNQSCFEDTYHDLLSEALTTLHTGGEKACPSWIDIRRVPIDPESSHTYLQGHVFDFLNKHYPQNANQAKSLIEALLVHIAKLSVNTDRSLPPAELLTRHGFSRTEFKSRLETMEQIPDHEALLVDGLNTLQKEGIVGFIESTKVKAKLTNISVQKLQAQMDPDYTNFLADYIKWFFSADRSSDSIQQIVSAAENDLASDYSLLTRDIFIAYVLSGTIQCVDQISAN